MKICAECGVFEVHAGCRTCLRSECQEAAYAYNLLINARKGSKSAASLRILYDRLKTVAETIARRKAGLANENPEEVAK